MSKRVPIKNLTTAQWRDICNKQIDPCSNCPLLFETDYPRCIYKYLMGVDDINKFLDQINKEVEVEAE